MATPTFAVTSGVTDPFTPPSASSSAVTSHACITTSSSSTAATRLISRLSPSAALGVGFAAGVIATVTVLTSILFVYRCWKVRRSPAVQSYEQARLWRGFTPATPNANTARTTLVEAKMKDIYFSQIRSPALNGQVQTQGWSGRREGDGERFLGSSTTRSR
ncbi:hypothetical protein HBI56_141220 [Parastagonospora nodorum]|nr:hypothetical protein HBH56_126620 [Parastagonospora nodorum]QRD05807.1 hypothetical protein JI435_060810 [Parastagonospora nodorum SN15]KAH3931384.1 hypothetical protein HBH54_096890 [Parastagonospora nodorum]KAH3947164.1 hypothetical protein HBH53_116880 [Parastagonospora nodorum]KAH3970676.1 hypothetical protein HBH51_113330 [Parastagonospora nodorum]